jgi:transcriptional regulator with XRE-family HTH domain
VTFPQQAKNRSRVWNGERLQAGPGRARLGKRRRLIWCSEKPGCGSGWVQYADILSIAGHTPAPTARKVRQNQRLQLVIQERPPLNCLLMTPRETVKCIALALKSKRRELGLDVRQAGRLCGVSASTISRLERSAIGKLPDAVTLVKLSKWLDLPLTQFLGSTAESEPKSVQSTLPEIVDVHLRADPRFDPKSARALSEIFRVLYENLAQGAGRG